MKKKIIISVLLVVCLFAVTIISIPKASAAETPIQKENEYFYYDDSVKDELLNIPINEQQGLAFRYASNGPLHIITSDDSYGANGWLSINSYINAINVDYEYISMPSFGVGYWIDFNSIEFTFYYSIGDVENATTYLELFIDDNNQWYDFDGNLITDFRYYTGFEKYHITNGSWPNSLVPITSITQTGLDISVSVDLDEYYNSNLGQDVPCLLIQVDINSFNGFESIYCYYPINSISGLGAYNLSNYVGNTYTSTYLSQPKMYTPMSYFVYLTQIDERAYDKGYDTGFDEGYLDGYVDGQDSLNISFTDWISTAVGGFLDFQIIPGLSLMSILSFIISLGLLFLILRFFSGG